MNLLALLKMKTKFFAKQLATVLSRTLPNILSELEIVTISAIFVLFSTSEKQVKICFQHREGVLMFMKFVRAQVCSYTFCEITLQ